MLRKEQAGSNTDPAGYSKNISAWASHARVNIPAIDDNRYILLSHNTQVEAGTLPLLLCALQACRQPDHCQFFPSHNQDLGAWN
jgi:hypothetical protein